MKSVSPHEKEPSPFEGRAVQNVENVQYDVKGKLTGFTIFCLLITAIGCPFQLGFNAGLYNTPGEQIQNFYNNTYRDQNQKYMDDSTWTSLWSITNGLMPGGGIIGGMVSGTVADLLGRKKAMLAVNILVFCSGILNGISKPAKTYYTIMVGRFLAGLFSGLFSGIAPLYLSELPPHNWRGFSGVIFQLFVTIGLLFSNIIGLPQLLGTEKLWPFLAAFCVVPGIIHVSCAPFFVESPKYLYLKKNDSDGAREVLKKLRGSDSEEYIEYEMEQMANERASQTEEVSYADLFRRRSLLRPLIITIVIQLSQQLSGINAVVFYSTNIFNSVGVEGNAALYATTGLAVVQVVMTFITMILIDKAGRRLLLLIGLSGMAVSCFVLAISGLLVAKADPLKYLSIAATVAYMILFSVGPGAIPWLITAELFNSSARGKASSIAVLTNWSSNCIVTFTFPIINKAIGSYSFIIFGILLVLFSLYTYFFVPETKGKTQEEISALFESDSNSSSTYAAKL